MKETKLGEWTISVNSFCITVQEKNILAVFEEDKHFVILFSIDQEKNLSIERCSTSCKCVIDHTNKRVELCIGE